MSKRKNAVIYLVIIIFIVAAVLAWCFFNNKHLDCFSKLNRLDNYRYLLSALSQTQAAIIGLLLAVLVLGIQLTTQSYSPKLSELFYKNRLFWALVFSYCLSIIYDLFLLSIKESYWTNLAIIFSIVLLILNLGLLFPFMMGIFEKLKIENVINDKIINIRKSYGNKELNATDLDHVFEICKRAIRNDDINIIRYALNSLSPFIKEIGIISPESQGEPKLKEEIITYLKNQLGFILKKSYEARADDSFNEITNLLKVMKDGKGVYESVSYSILNIWPRELRIALLYYEEMAIENIEEFINFNRFGNIILEKNEELFYEFIQSYGQFCVKLAEQILKDKNEAKEKDSKPQIFNALDKWMKFYITSLRKKWRIPYSYTNITRVIEVVTNYHGNIIAYDIYIYLLQSLGHLIAEIAKSELEEKAYTIHAFIYFFKIEFESIIEKESFEIHNDEVLSQIIVSLLQYSDIAIESNLKGRDPRFPIEEDMRVLMKGYLEELKREVQIIDKKEIEEKLSRAIEIITKENP